MASERWVVKHSGDWYLSKDGFGTPHKRRAKRYDNRSEALAAAGRATKGGEVTMSPTGSASCPVCHKDSPHLVRAWGYHAAVYPIAVTKEMIPNEVIHYASRAALVITQGATSGLPFYLMREALQDLSLGWVVLLERCSSLAVEAVLAVARERVAMLEARRVKT